jgi:hypothetical protein
MALWGYPGWSVLHSLGRAKNILMDRMFRDPRLEDEFQSKTGLTLEQFLTCMAAVMCMGLGLPNQGTGQHNFIFNEQTFWAKSERHRPMIEKFFSAFSTATAEFRSAFRSRQPDDSFDYKVLRNSPILKFADGRCLVSDSIFFQQCAAVGPVFRVLGLEPNFVFGAFGE